MKLDKDIEGRINKLLIFVLLGIIRDVWSSSNDSPVEGFIGSNVSIQCPCPAEKFVSFCKANGADTSIFEDGMIPDDQIDRYSYKDEHLVIHNLTEKDNGTYVWKCGRKYTRYTTTLSVKIKTVMCNAGKESSNHRNRRQTGTGQDVNCQTTSTSKGMQMSRRLLLIIGVPATIAFLMLIAVVAITIRWKCLAIEGHYQKNLKSNKVEPVYITVDQDKCMEHKANGQKPELLYATIPDEGHKDYQRMLLANKGESEYSVVDKKTMLEITTDESTNCVT